MITTVLAGGLAPEGVKAIISQGESGIDLTTVSAASISVKNPAGAIVSWAATILSATARTLVIRHLYGASDVASLGTYYPVAILTVSGGTIRAKLDPIQVIDPYGSS